MNNYAKFKQFTFEKYDKLPYNKKHTILAEEILLRVLSHHPKVDQLKLLIIGHDLFEDTETTKEDLKFLISPDIIEGLSALTDGEGKNRFERHLNTYYKIRENEDFVIAKLCDRISHLEQDNVLNCYLKEKDTFKCALYNPNFHYAKKLWNIYDQKFKELEYVCK